MPATRTAKTHPAPAITIRGKVLDLIFSSAKFSVGLLDTEDGNTITFAGPCCVKTYEQVAFIGRWADHPKYGRQFKVEGMNYDLPQNGEGLYFYLMKSPEFNGVGPVTARRLVEWCSAKHNGDFSLLVNDDLAMDAVRAELRIPIATLRAVREAWNANAETNKFRTYLAGFELTPHQIDTLLATIGPGVVTMLQSNPYGLMGMVPGYGFIRIDQIALRMGTAKNAPGRIAGAIDYAFKCEMDQGHTWIDPEGLIQAADKILALDTLHAQTLIRTQARELLQNGALAFNEIGGTRAVSLPWLWAAEEGLADLFRAFALNGFGGTIHDPPEAEFPLNAKQQVAYTNAFKYTISVISGEAGTGKTFVVGRIVQACQHNGIGVILCAPTGKAAKRLEEMLLTKYNCHVEAFTIHRLLGYDGESFGAGMLDANMVIVDEASMIDVPLMAELFSHLDLSRTSLVLVGDHHQLPPVGPGLVLRDVIQHGYAPTVVLDEVVRQAGVLKANSVQMLAGKIKPTDPEKKAWIVIDAFEDAENVQLYLRDLVVKTIPQKLGFDVMRDVQIITPTHKGPLGTHALNNMFRRALIAVSDRKFAIGDRVIQMRNNYRITPTGLMNGTQGWVRDITPHGFVIEFAGEGEVRVEDDDVDDVELAYALTAHKAQGSEWPCVVAVCHKSHYFADRNWLYTAVTRASKCCVLVGDKWGLHNAAKKNVVVKRRTVLGLMGKEST